MGGAVATYLRHSKAGIKDPRFFRNYAIAVLWTN